MDDLYKSIHIKLQYIYIFVYLYTYNIIHYTYMIYVWLLDPTILSELFVGLG